MKLTKRCDGNYMYSSDLVLIVVYVDRFRVEIFTRMEHFEHTDDSFEGAESFAKEFWNDLMRKELGL